MSSTKAPHYPIQPRSWPIEQLPGLSQIDGQKLLECGITTTGQLIAATRTKETKQALASQLQIHPQYVSKWVAMAELSSIPSINCQYCGLLLHAGIASVSQLAQTPVHRLHQQILRLHVATMQRRDLCPSVEEVQGWIKQAGMLIAKS
jgi:predicted RecB family nuclease